MDSGTKAQQAQMVAEVAYYYWRCWVTKSTPAQVIRQRWHKTQGNLQVGDLVLVHDANKIRNKYQLAKVTEVKVSSDGLVRSCTVGFRQTRSPTKHKKYRSVWQTLQRSIQRLTLLLPIEEQTEDLVVTNGEVHTAAVNETNQAEVYKSCPRVSPSGCEEGQQPLGQD